MQRMRSATSQESSELPDLLRCIERIFNRQVGEHPLTNMKTLINFSPLSIFRSGIDPDEKFRQLDREKHRLMLQAHTLFHQLQLSHHQLFKSAKADCDAAAEKLSAARRSHPALRLLFLKNDAAKRRIDKTRMNGESPDFGLARLEKIRADIDQTSTTILKLRKLAKKVKQAELAITHAKWELLATLPEGKKVLDAIEALDQKLDRLHHENQAA